MTLGSRLREERERLGLSQTQLGELGGVGKMSQINYEKDQRLPKADYLAALEAAGVDMRYVVTGQRTPSHTAASPAAYRVDDGAPVAATAGPGPGMAAVALYDVEGAAGDGRSLEGERIEGELYFPEAQLAALGVSPGQVAGIKVRGDSMEGTLDDGDWVLVDLANRDPRRSGVFLLWQSGERRIKRVQRLPGGALQLISDNTHYPPEMIRPEDMRDVEILGRCEVRIGRVS